MALIAFDLALQSKKCSDEIAVALYRHIVGQEGSELEDCIDLIQTPQVDNKLYRIKHKYGIDLRPIVSIKPRELSSSEEEYESDISEEQEISENQELAALEHQETGPQPEISEPEVEAGPSAKRPRFE